MSIKSKKKGFTLLEMVVALSIFGLLIVPISDMVRSIINMNKKSNENVEVAEVMNEAYEKGVAKNFKFDDSEKDENENIDFGNYKVHYDISDENISDVNGIKNDSYDIRIDVIKNAGSDGDTSVLKVKKVQEEKLPIDVKENNTITINVKEEGSSLIYKITNKDIKKTVTVKVDEPVYSILFNAEEDAPKLNIILDGVYSDDNNICPKSLNFNYYTNEGSNNIVSTTPYIAVAKKYLEPNNTAQNGTKKVDISIMDKSGSEIAKQTFYFKDYKKSEEFITDGSR